MKYTAISVLLLIAFIFPYTLSIVVEPSDGNAAIDDGVVSYFYPDEVNGSFLLDSFSVRLVDVNGLSDTALYKVIVIPREELNYYVIPNPMEVRNNSAKDIDWEILDYLNLSAYKYQKGSAIVISTRLNLDLDRCHGTIRIFDPVGNIVNHDTEMEWVVASDNKNIGVAVWNGRNNNGRIVGSGAYLVIIDATLFYDRYTDDGVKNESKHVMYKVMVGVKYH